MRRVAVIEDSADVRSLVLLQITTSGSLSLAWSAATVAEARDLLVADPPDVVLLDLILPDGSGFEVVDAIPVDVPWWLFTGIYDADVRVKALQRGAAGVLRKQATRSELIDALSGVRESGGTIDLPAGDPYHQR